MIRVRAILVIFFTTLLIVFFSILVAINTVRSSLDTSQAADLLLISDIADHFISSEIAELKTKANGVAQLLSLTDKAHWDKAMSDVESSYPEFIGLSVWDMERNILASSGRLAATFDEPNEIDEGYLQKAIRGEEIISSAIKTDTETVFYISTPLLAGSDMILTLTLPAEYFSELLSSFAIWESGHIFMDDSDGVLIANPRQQWVDNRVDFTQMAEIDEENAQTVWDLRQGVQTQATVVRYSISSVPRLCAYRPVSGSDEGWVLGVVAPLPESPFRHIDKGLVTVGLVSVLLGLIAAIIASAFIKRPFDQIEALKEEAEAISMYKSDFLANMSHEIRTPMNSILGIAEILKRDNSLSVEVFEWIEKIHNSGNLLLGIINDILDLSKIEAGKLELSISSYETASLINDTVSFHTIGLESKPIEFSVFVDENIPQLLLGDELRIKKILNNLLSNAFKYTEKGDIILSFAVGRNNELGEEEFALVISVSDTGRGMTQEQVSALFERFTRFDTETRKVIEGTGIGMSITQNLTRMMNGHIEVESEPGVGSVFTVTLLQGKVSDSQVIGKELAESLQNFSQSGIRQIRKAQIVYEPMPYGSILIVDDVESNLLIASGLMLPYELSIDTVTSGFDAIDKVTAGQVYDIIFMDHMMPNMDGVEALKAIRELGYKKPIVALTANAVKGQQEMFLANGFDAFLSKPIDIRELNSVLKKYVRDAYSQDDIDAAAIRSASAGAGSGAPGDMQASVSLRLAEAFVKDAEKMASVLEGIMEKSGSYSQDDLSVYTTNVHGLKSALANVGEQELSEFAANLENAGRSGVVSTIIAETPVFLQRLRKAMGKYARPASGNQGDSSKEGDYEQLYSNMLSIKDACDTYDRKTVKESLVRLQCEKWQSPVDELLSAMADYLLVGDFEEVSQAADTILDHCPKA